MGKGLNKRSPISRVDTVKGKSISLAVLSHNNSILLSGDSSRQLGEQVHFEDSSEANSN